MLRHTPIHRLGEVSDIAQAVLFFASPASAWISGQVFFVNGGGDQTLDYPPLDLVSYKIFSAMAAQASASARAW